ncbi:hypothetical protein LCGC14_3121800 [marine sediment metagenome]|uniref:Uncharacterized protein n=1 Tax=marine sediment metagenome TaxID=412755 RepID=A0A0F8YRV9_9ZZZZ
MNTKYIDLIDQTFYFPQEDFKLEDNHLRFHDIDLMSLVEQYGSPLKFSYLPSISNNLTENYHKYDAKCKMINSFPQSGLTPKQKSELRKTIRSKIDLYKKEFLLFLFFKDILEDDEILINKQNYIIEKTITKGFLITDLLDSSAHYLKQILKDYRLSAVCQ